MRRLVTLSVIVLSLILTASAAAGPRTVVTGQAVPVTDTTATLHGDVYSTEGSVTYHFDYGTTSAYGSSTAPTTVANGSITTTISGLTPVTGYHYRLVASDSTGETVGLDWTFTTQQTAAPAQTPAAPTDRDGDGIPDQADRCPDQAGHGFGDDYGCPDSDGDTIADRSDACPNQDGRGVPGGCPDRDGDGVLDKDDQCPDENGDVAHHGCADSDLDGVYSPTDKCPEIYGPDRPDGCSISFGYAVMTYRQLTDILNPKLTYIACMNRPLTEDCFFHFVLRLTPASARSLGLKNSTVFDVSGKATKRKFYSKREYYYSIPSSEFDLSPAVARALRKAKKATFVATGTFRLGKGKPRPMTDGGRPITFTLTTKEKKTPPPTIQTTKPRNPPKPAGAENLAEEG
jgi:hypothetical protein